MHTAVELKDLNIAHTLNGAPYTDVERSGTNSHNSDVKKLARMGKKQLLKVCDQLRQLDNISGLCLFLTAIASIWLLVIVWVQLHYSNHVGDRTGESFSMQ